MKVLDIVQITRDMRVTVDLPQGLRGVVVDEGGAELANGVRNFLVEFCDDEGRGFVLHLAEGEIRRADTPPTTVSQRCPECGMFAPSYRVEGLPVTLHHIGCGLAAPTTKKEEKS